MPEAAMDSNKYFLRLRGKVRGPYSVDQLRRMTSRGEFSRMHQISTDQLEWKPATDLAGIFESQDPATKAQTSSIATREAPAAQWFYAVGNQRLGPVSRDALLQLIQNRQLTGATLVWQNEMPDWIPAESVFAGAFSSTPRRFRSIGAVVAWAALAVVLMVGGITGSMYWQKTNLRSSQPQPLGQVFAGGNPRGEIRSADVSAASVSSQINEAVGMVVCYLEINMHDGVHHERWFSHGTGFVVNSSGYALTNRHVIQGHQEWMNATPKGRIKKLLSIYLDAFDIHIKRDKELAKAFKQVCDEIATITPHCVTYFGTKGYPTKVHFVSTKYDMAVLQIEGLTDPPWFALSTENVVPKLTRVIAMGFPGVSQEAVTESEEAVLRMKAGQSIAERLLGTSDHRDAKKASAFEMTPTPGDISVVQQESGGIFNAQSTAPIRGGNSGGPLVLRDDSRLGTVYAINTLFLKDDAPVFIAFPVAQMKAELEAEAKVPDLKWR